MNTHLLVRQVSHSEDTTAFRADVYDNHPAHDGELLFYLDAVIKSDMSDLYFDHVTATPFHIQPANFAKMTTEKHIRAGKYVDPYHLKNALEMVLEHLGSGDCITRIEEEQLISEDVVTELK